MHSMICEARGLMLVVDASCLYLVVSDGVGAEAVRERLSDDQDHAAPHLIDAEVLSVIRRDHRLGRLDHTAALQAIDDLRAWPGERFGHRTLLERAWELRDNLRSWDALYVALAEGLGVKLLTLDERLSRANGVRCPVEVVATV